MQQNDLYAVFAVPLHTWVKDISHILKENLSWAINQNWALRSAVNVALVCSQLSNFPVFTVAANLQKIVDDPHSNKNVTFKLVSTQTVIYEVMLWLSGTDMSHIHWLSQFVCMELAFLLKYLVTTVSFVLVFFLFQASGVEESEIPDDIKLIGFAQLSIS